MPPRLSSSVWRQTGAPSRTVRTLETRRPYWNASVAAGKPRHVLVVGHEEGWAEVWRYLVHWLRGPKGDHANKARTWFSRPCKSTIRASLLLRSLWLTKAAAAVRGPGAMANQCVRRPLQQTPARSPA